MGVHIQETGNGQIIEGPVRVVKDHGATRVFIGERDLTCIIAESVVGHGCGVKELGQVRISWEKLEEDA